MDRLSNISDFTSLVHYLLPSAIGTQFRCFYFIGLSGSKAAAVQLKKVLEKLFKI